MKVCVVSERGYSSGASIAAFRLADALADCGHEIDHVFVRGELPVQHKNDGVAVHKLTYLPIFTKYVADHAPQALFRLHCLLNRMQLLRLLRTIQPDVISLHSIVTMLRHTDIDVISQEFPVVWTLHGRYGIFPYNNSYVNRQGDYIEVQALNKRFVDELGQAKLLRSAETNLTFVTPSHWLTNEVTPQLNTQKTLQRIPNGLDPIQFYDEGQASARDALELDEDKFYLLFVAGQLSYELKNLSVLLEALALLTDLPLQLLALGHGTEDALSARGVHYLGRTYDIDRIRKIYSAADAFVITSLIDNLPNTVMESLFCGTPVIGSNVGGIPDMVVPDKTGWLFDPYNPQQLADVIRQVYEQRETLPEMGVSGREWAVAQFNATKQAEQYTALFEQVIQ